MKTAIITGATSYLGIELAKRLVAEGIEVHAVQRPGSDLARLNAAAPGAIIHLYDGSQTSLTDIFARARPDVVFHLAGKYVRDEQPGDIDRLLAANITFGSQLLEAARGADAKGFVNTGSYFQFSDEGAAPVNFYAACKNAFAEILGYYESLNTFAVTSLIIFDTYGPGDWRQKLFPAIAEALQNKSVLPIPAEDIQLYPVYLSDVIDCFIQAAAQLLDEPGSVAGKSFAVRGESASSIKDIVKVFEDVGGASISVKPGDWPKPARAVIEIWRGDTLPGWYPKHSLSQGIKSMIGA